MRDSPRILVTGATGFLGRHLVFELKDRYPNIAALVRKTSNTDYLKKLDIELRQGDLKDRYSLRQCLTGIDIVIHLAGLMSDKDYLPESEFYRVNVGGTQNIIEEAFGKLKQFIYISSVGVYGPTSKVGVNEDHPYGTKLSKYEHSKKEAERLIISFAACNAFPYTVLRLGQLYGPYMEYGWPEVIRNIEAGRMFIIGKGEKLLQLTYVGDAVKGIINCINHDRCIGQIFNLCGSRAYKMKDIFFEISRQLNKPFPKNLPFAPVYLATLLLNIIPHSIKPKRLRYLDAHRLSFFRKDHVYSIDKAKAYFGYLPEIGLSEGILKMIQWYRESQKR